MVLITTTNELNSKNKHLAKLTSNDAFDMINIQLKTGEVIPEHDAPYQVIIIVRRGIVEFTVENTIYTLGVQEILTMEKHQKHQLQAIEDADVLVIKVK